MKGTGADEEAIVAVLVEHDSYQRMEILRLYKTLFGRDLMDDLKAELSGKFETAVKAMMTPKPLYMAKELSKAMKGLGTDEGALIEILCAHMNQDMLEIKRCFKEETDKDLEDELASDVSGHIKNLLIAQSNAGRDEEGSIDYDKLDNDVDQIVEASKRKFSSDTELFMSVLSSRCYNQLYGTFERYKEDFGVDIEETIKDQTSGLLETGLLTIVRFTKDPNMYYARRLHEAMKGSGTDDRCLVRVIVYRSEEDLAQIASAFYSLYEKPLTEFIAAETSGDYRKLLLAIIGNN